jgi:hypothetical protein
MLLHSSVSSVTIRFFNIKLEQEVLFPQVHQIKWMWTDNYAWVWDFGAIQILAFKRVQLSSLLLKCELELISLFELEVVDELSRYTN